MSVKSFSLRLLLGLCLSVGAFVLLNPQYFWSNFKYDVLGKPRQPVIVVPITDTQIRGSEKGHDLTQPNLLIIQSIGVSVPVQYVDKADESVFQQALQNGVVHYPGTADVGQPGNVYIFGHSSDFLYNKGNYKTVFALLPRVKTGDVVLLSDKQGIVYKYIAQTMKVVANNDTSVLQQGDGSEKILTLQTSYPVGTALKRYVVICKLQENNP